MDKRYTSRNEIGQGVLELKSQVGEWAVYPRHNMSEFVVLGESIDRLAAYEDTDLAPELVVALKRLCKERDDALMQKRRETKALERQLAKLEEENARLEKLIKEIDDILRKGEE